MKSFRSLAARLLIIIFIVVFAQCIGCAKKDSKMINIGAILPLTGPLATYGDVIKNALTLAFEEVNEKGGINGRSVKLLIEDGAGDPKTSVSAFQKLMLANKPKVIVTTVSSVSLALAPLADQNRIILFAEASHPKISGISPYVFRHSNTAFQDATALTDYIKVKLHLQTISFLIVNDDYGEAMNQELQKSLSGVKIIKNLTFDKNEMDFRTLAQRILIDNPQGILIVGYGKGFGIALKRFREMGYKGQILTGFAFQLTKDAAISAGDAAKGLYYPTFKFALEKTSQISNLERKYIDKYGTSPSSFFYIEYDTAQLIAEAIRNVGYDAEALKDYLHNPPKYDGVTGELTILKTGDILSPVTVVEYH